MDDSVKSGLVTGGGGFLGSVISAISTARQNKKQRQWLESRYAIEKQDKQDAWAMENAYNSPEQQMTRLRQAGLNPNLVYGKGADNTAASVSTPSTGSNNPQRVPIDTSFIGQGVSQYWDARLKAVQTDNIAQQTAVQAQDEANKRIDNVLKLIEVSKGQLDFKQALELYDSRIERYKLENTQIGIGIEATKAGIEKTKAETKTNEAQRQKILQDINHDVQRMGIEKAQSIHDIELLYQRAIEAKVKNSPYSLERQILGETLVSGRLHNIVLKLDAELAKRGIKPTDPMYAREFQKAMNNLVDLGKFFIN